MLESQGDLTASSAVDGSVATDQNLEVKDSAGGLPAYDAIQGGGSASPEANEVDSNINLEQAVDGAMPSEDILATTSPAFEVETADMVAANANSPSGVDMTIPGNNIVSAPTIESDDDDLYEGLLQDIQGLPTAYGEQVSNAVKDGGVKTLEPSSPTKTNVQMTEEDDTVDRTAEDAQVVEGANDLGTDTFAILPNQGTSAVAELSGDMADLAISSASNEVTGATSEPTQEPAVNKEVADAKDEDLHTKETSAHEPMPVADIVDAATITPEDNAPKDGQTLHIQEENDVVPPTIEPAPANEIEVDIVPGDTASGETPQIDGVLADAPLPSIRQQIANEMEPAIADEAEAATVSDAVQRADDVEVATAGIGPSSDPPIEGASLENDDEDVTKIQNDMDAVDGSATEEMNGEGGVTAKQESSPSPEAGHSPIDVLPASIFIPDSQSADSQSPPKSLESVNSRRRILSQSLQESEALLSKILDPKVVPEEELPSLEDILSKHTGKGSEVVEPPPYMSLDKVAARRRSSVIASLNVAPTDGIPHPANLLRIAASTGKSSRAMRRASIVTSTPVEARITYSTADAIGGATVKTSPASPSPLSMSSSPKLDTLNLGASARSWDLGSPISHRLDHRKVIVLERHLEEEDEHEDSTDFHEMGILNSLLAKDGHSPSSQISPGYSAANSLKSQSSSLEHTKVGFSATSDSLQSTRTSKYLSYERTLSNKTSNDSSKTAKNVSSRRLSRNAPTDTTRKDRSQSFQRSERRESTRAPGEQGAASRMTTRYTATRSTVRASSKTKTTGGKVVTRPEFPDRGLETLKNLTQTVGGINAKPLSKEPAYAQLGEHSTLAKSIVGPIYEAVGLSKPEMDVLATNMPYPQLPSSNSPTYASQGSPSASGTYSHQFPLGQSSERAYYNYDQFSNSHPYSGGDPRYVGGGANFHNTTAPPSSHYPQAPHGYSPQGQAGPYYLPELSPHPQHQFYFPGEHQHSPSGPYDQTGMMHASQGMHGMHPVDPRMYNYDAPGPYAQSQSMHTQQKSNEPKSVLPTHFGMFPTETFNASSYGLNPKENEAEFDKVQTKLNKLRDQQAKRINYEKLQRTYMPHQ